MSFNPKKISQFNVTDGVATTDIVTVLAINNLTATQNSILTMENFQKKFVTDIDANEFNLTNLGGLEFTTTPPTAISSSVPFIQDRNGQLNYNVPSPQSHNFKVDDFPKLLVTSDFVALESNVTFDMNNNTATEAGGIEFSQLVNPLISATVPYIQYQNDQLRLNTPEEKFIIFSINDVPHLSIISDFVVLPSNITFDMGENTATNSGGIEFTQAVILPISENVPFIQYQNDILRLNSPSDKTIAFSISDNNKLTVTSDFVALESNVTFDMNNNTATEAGGIEFSQLVNPVISGTVPYIQHQTNMLTSNVPTSQTHSFTVNNSPKLTVSANFVTLATGVDFAMNNNMATESGGMEFTQTGITAISRNVPFIQNQISFLILNVPPLKTISFRVNNFGKLSITSDFVTLGTGVTLDMEENDITDIIGIRFGSILSTPSLPETEPYFQFSVTPTTDRMLYNVPTDQEHSFTIGGVEKFFITSDFVALGTGVNFDINENNITNLGGLIFSQDAGILPISGNVPFIQYESDIFQFNSPSDGRLAFSISDLDILTVATDFVALGSNVTFDMNNNTASESGGIEFTQDVILPISENVPFIQYQNDILRLNSPSDKTIAFSISDNNKLTVTSDFVALESNVTFDMNNNTATESGGMEFSQLVNPLISATVPYIQYQNDQLRLNTPEDKFIIFSINDVPHLSIISDFVVLPSNITFDMGENTATNSGGIEFTQAAITAISENVPFIQYEMDILRLNSPSDGTLAFSISDNNVVTMATDLVVVGTDVNLDMNFNDIVNVVGITFGSVASTPFLPGTSPYIQYNTQISPDGIIYNVSEDNKHDFSFNGIGKLFLTSDEMNFQPNFSLVMNENRISDISFAAFTGELGTPPANLSDASLFSKSDTVDNVIKLFSLQGDGTVVGPFQGPFTPGSLTITDILLKDFQSPIQQFVNILGNTDGPVNVTLSDRTVPPGTVFYFKDTNGNAGAHKINIIPTVNTSLNSLFQTIEIVQDNDVLGMVYMGLTKGYQTI